MITVVEIAPESSLGADARAAVPCTDPLDAVERQLALLSLAGAGERRAWTERLTALVSELPRLDEGRVIVVVASGDPLLHGAGLTILRGRRRRARQVHPGRVVLRARLRPASIDVAGARLRGRQSKVELVSASGRANERGRAGARAWAASSCRVRRGVPDAWDPRRDRPSTRAPPPAADRRAEWRLAGRRRERRPARQGSRARQRTPPNSPPRSSTSAPPANAELTSRRSLRVPIREPSCS